MAAPESDQAATARGHIIATRSSAVVERERSSSMSPRSARVDIFQEPRALARSSSPLAAMRQSVAARPVSLHCAHGIESAFI